MAKYIDETMWWDALGEPDWYVRLADDFTRLEALAKKHSGDPSYKQIKREAYALVERAIRENHIPLAKQGEAFDTERRPIDTIVIHHTKNAPGMTLDRLNAMQLLRIYGMYYANPTNNQRFLHGQPVWSGHFYENRQVFWGYHWFIRADGTAEQILTDEYIGWHAGNWDINTRSIGICIDDDLSSKEPSEAALATVARVLQEKYCTVKPANIIGHRDANPRTVCPGDLFHTHWRQKIINRLLEATA
ncbi:MAG TPA: peptidoglycan recognition family protein [Candidatus Saccharimonadia bacterium]|nr:peptidoglycan recognition family protein [Candidatus Saccharimonadia bacterium]